MKTPFTWARFAFWAWCTAVLMAPLAHAQANLPLRSHIESGAFNTLTDEDVIRQWRALPASAVSAYLEGIVRPLNSYELRVQRQERIGGEWNARPYLNVLKYHHAPRRLYVKWLDGGPKAGQEIIYDETRRKDQIYAHLGGMMNLTSVWLTLDSPLIRGNTNHHVRDDLNLQFFVRTVTQRLQSMPADASLNQATVEVLTVGKKRCVAVTLPSSASASGLYTGKLRFALELDRVMLKQFEAWDAQQVLIERIVIDQLNVRPMTDADFDPKNPGYDF